MSKLFDMVGREILNLTVSDGEYIYQPNFKITLEYEKHTGSQAFIDCFFAVAHNAKGEETWRLWLGQGCAIVWKEVKDE